MTMTETKSDTQTLQLIANTIRGLSMDGVEAAGCGHPGLPLGCAELGAYLYAKVLRHHPQKPDWINRDRFILSAGHGSMLLYSLLHLAGFELSLDDLKDFRQLHAKTAGHPEYGYAAGIETTTGPLGQGVATGVGMALAQKMAEASFGLEDQGMLDASVYVLAGDGCMMEGISSEASSLAGHLKLDNLVLIYDANDICLDGPISECLSEDTAMRYESYGWHVQVIDGHSFEEIAAAFEEADESDKPSLIIAKTTIGQGSPNMSGTSDVHGKAMGAEEVALTKQQLGIPESPLFYVPEEVKSFFATRQQEQSDAYQAWSESYEAWRVSHPELATRWDQQVSRALPTEFSEKLKSLPISENVATRQSSNAVLQFLHESVPFIVGGSADLSCSDSTMMKASPCVNTRDFAGRNIKFGVREFAMGAMVNGISLQGHFLPFCGTFLMFSDYMRNAIRLAALMEIPVVYQFTHDSVLLGEDGPTHQPVEHLASLRAVPNLVVIRPADATEVKGAWLAALTLKKPVALILSRQKIKDLTTTSFEQVSKGAYVVSGDTTDTDLTLLATGSELSLAEEVAEALREHGKSVRVVSVPSFELFDEQSLDYQNQVLGHSKYYASIEAQSSFGWHKYIGRDGLSISVDRFGLSAPLGDIQTEYGFTKAQILDRLKETFTDLL